MLSPLRSLSLKQCLMTYLWPADDLSTLCLLGEVTANRVTAKWLNGFMLTPWNYFSLFFLFRRSDDNHKHWSEREVVTKASHWVVLSVHSYISISIYITGTTKSTQWLSFVSLLKCSTTFNGIHCFWSIHSLTLLRIQRKYKYILTVSCFVVQVFEEVLV